MIITERDAVFCETEEKGRHTRVYDCWKALLNKQNVAGITATCAPKLIHLTMSSYRLVFGVHAIVILIFLVSETLNL